MQPLLLDTHAFIWFVNGDDSLSKKARQAIENNALSTYVSICTIWEIGIKISLGKLQLNKSFNAIKHQLVVNGFQLLQLTIEDTLKVAELPFLHRDPFDRILIAQPINNHLSIVTIDEKFHQYEISIFW